LLLKAALIQMSDYRLLGASGLSANLTYGHDIAMSKYSLYVNL
jgi:hypothetical protein